MEESKKTKAKESTGTKGGKKRAAKELPVAVGCTSIDGGMIEDDDNDCLESHAHHQLSGIYQFCPDDMQLFMTVNLSGFDQQWLNGVQPLVG